MSETASKAEQADAVRTSMYRVVIRASIETVWSELIRTDRPLPFFFGGQYDTPGLKTGAPFAMRSPDGKFTMAMGEVIEFDPPRRYAHTFRFTTSEDPASIVRYQLKEVDGGTEFTLINEHPAGDPVSKSEKQMAQGAKFISENLKSVVETGKATFGGQALLFMFSLMAPMTPKTARSENWPLDRAPKG
ncbi:SRPBCC domain-containing protein [Maricaulis sp.]|uniref:SRPBCC domain-containing protein n=1 Tax=Maricaulis sp. TaxID=1486257 RepID=UPI001B05958B|nr:SRPBCC domain-containing protein [Maricaulis sp.]MBO6764450.1 SRPBCC domain-containing protein [Maricaulis sp.]